MKLNRFGAKSSYREMLLVQQVAIGPSQVNLDRHKIDRTFRVVNSVVKILWLSRVTWATDTDTDIGK